MPNPPSPGRVQELLRYCPSTGKLFWKTYRNSQAQVGQEAGHVDQKSGYRVVGLDRKVMQAHRIIWFIHYGRWPVHQIDHINHDRTDNRISNLREVSQIENLHNKSKSRNNSSGQTGVYLTPEGKWKARICVKRKMFNLGTFADFSKAVFVRKTAEAQHNFHSNHGQ